MKKVLSLVFCSLLLLTYLEAQNHDEVASLETRFKQSSLVVEGKIIAQEGYFDEKQKMVFTKYEIEVIRNSVEIRIFIA